MSAWKPTEGWTLFVTCPDCAFEFSAEHQDTNDGGYSCPVCAEAALEARVQKLRDALRALVGAASEARQVLYDD